MAVATSGMECLEGKKNSTEITISSISFANLNQGFFGIYIGGRRASKIFPSADCASKQNILSAVGHFLLSQIPENPQKVSTLFFSLWIRNASRLSRNTFNFIFYSSSSSSFLPSPKASKKRAPPISDPPSRRRRRQSRFPHLRERKKGRKNKKMGEICPQSIVSLSLYHTSDRKWPFLVPPIPVSKGKKEKIFMGKWVVDRRMAHFESSFCLPASAFCLRSSSSSSTVGRVWLLGEWMARRRNFGTCCVSRKRNSFCPNWKRKMEPSLIKNVHFKVILTMFFLPI